MQLATYPHVFSEPSRIMSRNSFDNKRLRPKLATVVDPTDARSIEASLRFVERAGWSFPQIAQPSH
jgi:hypothetical protein